MYCNCKTQTRYQRCIIKKVNYLIKNFKNIDYMLNNYILGILDHIKYIKSKFLSL